MGRELVGYKYISRKFEVEVPSRIRMFHEYAIRLVKQKDIKFL